MRINVVSDIDNVLATNAAAISETRFFEKKGLVVEAAGKAQYIFPWTIEFLTLLLHNKEINLSIYSAGRQARNEHLTHQLLAKIYKDETKYKKVQSKVEILSRKDRARTQLTNEVQNFYEKYSIEPCSHHKDILKVLKKLKKKARAVTHNNSSRSGKKRRRKKSSQAKKYSLCHSVLIDDKSANIAPGQAHNFLYAGETKCANFAALEKKYEAYQAEAYRPLKCSFETNEDECFEVEQGKRIAVLKKDNEYEVWFIDKENILQKKKIPDEHFDLINNIKSSVDKGLNLDENDIFTDPDIVQKIHQLVESYNGRTKKLPRSTNRIFYITGLLFTAIELAKTKNISLSDALFELQFKKPKFTLGDSLDDDFEFLGGEDKFELSDNALRDNRLYELGLEKLREINPDVHFTTPYTYLRDLGDVKNITTSISKT